MYRCDFCRRSITTLDQETSFKTCQSIHAEPCDACKEFELLNQQISDAKAILDDLYSRRHQVNSRLNHFHPSIIHRMPTELVSSIFEFYIEPGQRYGPPIKGSPLILGRICQTWRRIAWSTPSLWNSIYLILGPIHKAQIRLAIEWLGRSGQLPLTITIQKSIILEDNHLHLVYPLIEAMNECSIRWVELNLDLPPSLSSRFRDSGGAASGLHDMSLQSRGLRLHDLDIRWNNLTNITAIFFHLNEVFEVIHRSLQLTTCHFELVDDGDDESLFTGEYDSISHPLLNSLNIKLGWQSAEFFFGSTTLPALKTLICQFSEEEVPGETIASFLIRSSCPLRDFTLTQAIIYAEDIIQIARAAPLITSLYLRPCVTDVIPPASRRVLPSSRSSLPKFRKSNLCIHGATSSFS